MDWLKGKISINQPVVFPDKKYQDKYFIGLNLYLGYKEILLLRKDNNYSVFLAIYEKIEHATKLDFDRAYIVFQAAQATSTLPGSSAECGVYRGGGSALIASVNQDRKHFALDTFEGFPDVTSDIDIHRKGGFADTLIMDVKNIFQSYPNIIMLKDTFSQSFPGLQQESFSFVHIDADLYASTLECCEFFYKKMNQGGIMLFDDYLVRDTPGVKKAVDEFFSLKKEFPIVLPTMQAMVFKL
ncbi:MAG: TylF/MycF/NovP-related O-methyltransferase [Thermodesulfovibrionales bacterium]|nr:TylF/MycF/NovP-related O-methyltransferase [Thermodesulfovibrionales bacterium]